jgi:hypothetical protein
MIRERMLIAAPLYQYGLLIAFFFFSAMLPQTLQQYCRSPEVLEFRAARMKRNVPADGRKTFVNDWAAMRPKSAVRSFLPTERARRALAQHAGNIGGRREEG